MTITSRNATFVIWALAAVLVLWLISKLVW